MIKKTGILLFILTLLSSCTNYGEKKIFDGTEIYYKDGVTEAQADKLGKSLMDAEFTNGEVKSVQFVKDGDMYLFKMVIKEQFLEDKSLENIFNIFPKELSGYMDLPIDLHLCDSQFNTLRVYKLEDAFKTMMAKRTEIRYTDKVMIEDVEKLKDFLIEYGFSSDNVEKTVELDRESMTYIFKLIIAKNKLENEAVLSYLTRLKMELTKKVFSGLPVKIHMCDEMMNTLKEF
ncbi:hypothetical protein [uncultured Kordia sp.]|uniref:hypothetical protein n=1 Tax=uncultured Kordia sp. TaxID=507699 RepID=UPI002638BA03|nr:hypothetical protein [uncultured Kordia sp.]